MTTPTIASPAPPNEQAILEAARPVQGLADQVGRVVVGQAEMVRALLIGVLTDGHVLLEGVPGLAKTLTVTTLAKAMHADFSRIQFTPDLLPADLIGTLIYDPKEGTFTPRKGPVFANLVLADEINRAPAKVQSALLEAMQERSATIGDTTYQVGDPFLVLATQNPIEQEGTYRLPEAQVDRFMLKLRIGYPTKEDERAIIDRVVVNDAVDIDPVVTLDQIRTAKQAVRQVHLDERIRDYIVEVVHATRDPATSPTRFSMDLAKLIEFGASPRASISLAKAARAHAMLEGRAFVTPSDIKSIGMDVLRHRVVVGYEAEAEGVTPENIIQEIFNRIPIP